MTSILPTLRRILMAILVLGLLGAGVELILLEHTEELWQWVPLVLIPLGLVACAAVTVRPGRRTVWTFRGLMALFVIAGGLGVYRHYKGNVEFELEMRPDMAGLELFREAMMGATPALAPGLMAQLGLLGLALTYGHPSLARRDARDTEEGDRET